MKDYKISIIVPVYNVEKYLSECIESILKQTHTNLEIILIDDGSTDKSGSICDFYSQQDKRVTVIHQKNSGVGKVNNLGIEKATGDFIGIIESDDWIENNMYAELLKTAILTDADFVKCDFYYYNQFGKPQNIIRPHNLGTIQDLIPENKSFTITEYPLMLVQHASIWAGLYKSKFLKTLKFTETPNATYQDLPFTIEALAKANRIAVNHSYFVHYRHNEPGHSASVNRNDKKLMIMAKQCDLAKKILKKYNLLEPLKEEFYYHIAAANFGFYNKIDPKYKAEYLQKIRLLFSDVKTKELTYKYFKVRPELEAFLKDKILS